MILIIGGNGYIGTRITERLLNDNVEYSLFDIKNSKLKKNYYSGNVLDKESLREPISNASTVIYLAGAHLSNYEQNYDILIKGLSNCLELCSEYKVKRIIYASNGAVYSNLNCDKLHTEEDNIIVDSESREYSTLIHKAENMLIDVAKRENIKYVLLRIGEVYGPRIYNPILKNSISLLGDGHSISSKIHITDVINILYKIALNRQMEGVFNICDCCPVEQLTFYQYIKNHKADFCIKNIDYDSTIERLYWSIFGLRALNINMSNEKICKVLNYDFLFKSYKEGLNSLFSEEV